MTDPGAPRGAPPMRRRLYDVVRGVRVAIQGLRTWSTSARLMRWGLLPGAITTVIFGVIAVVIASQLWTWSGAIARVLVSTDGWFQTVIQLAAAVAITVGVVVVGFYTFTAVTLLVGQTFFERISREVDQSREGPGGELKTTWHRALVRGITEAGQLSLQTVPLALVLVLIGLVPVVGGIASFVLGAAYGGWFLALELTAYPFERRGVITLAQRRAGLRPHRAVVVGFGATVFVLFLIPLGPALFMPAAVAGATLLVQEITGTAA